MHCHCVNFSYFCLLPVLPMILFWQSFKSELYLDNHMDRRHAIGELQVASTYAASTHVVSCCYISGSACVSCPVLRHLRLRESSVCRPMHVIGMVGRVLLIPFQLRQ